MSNYSNFESIFKYIKLEKKLVDKIEISKEYIDDIENLLTNKVNYTFRHFKKQCIENIKCLIKLQKENLSILIKNKFNINKKINEIIKNKNDDEKKYILKLISFINLTKKNFGDFEKVSYKDWENIEIVVNRYENNFIENFIYFNFERYINEKGRCEHDVEKNLESIDIHKNITLTIINLFDNLDNFFNCVNITYYGDFVFKSDLVKGDYFEDYPGMFKIPDYFDNNPIWEGKKIVMVNGVEYSFISPTLNWVRKKFKNEIKNYIEFKMK